MAEAAPGRLCPPPPVPPPSTITAPPEPGVTAAEADEVLREEGMIELRGNVELQRDGRRVMAGRLHLDQATDRAWLDGGVYLATEEFLIHGERGETSLDTGAFTIDKARYHQRLLPAQGRAQRIARGTDGVARIDHGTFSTCPPEAEAWRLQAGSVTLDPAARQGTARNVSLWFHGVPLLYTPWFTFPLGDERKSGFLAPRVGQSSSSGTEVALPWYWNAAPNFDATLTPGLRQRRGGQFISQWRWLNRQGFWQLDHEYLPDDRLHGATRAFTRIQHDGRVGSNWGTAMDISSASDDEYFDDLGDELLLTSQTHLLRRADLVWREGNTRLRIRAQEYQTLDPTIDPANRPYEQKPRLTLNTHGDSGRWRLELDSEAVRYERDAGDTGDRLRIVPAISHPIERPGWFVRPRVAVDHTSYNLDRVDAGEPERIDRTLPISSLDAGLVFERPTERYRQTLEPRLFYVHVPYEDQDDIPLFDTARYDFSFSQLFRERQFTGGDRIGDADRLTIALTSRLLDAGDGRELLRASIGGIRHFSDRRVTLEPDDPIDDSTNSDLLAEFAVQPGPSWLLDSTVQWNPRDSEATRAAARIGYRGPAGGILNLGWRYRLDEQDQIDTSFAWPVHPRWQLLGRLTHSLQTSRNLEALAAVEYRSCCWSVRGVARRHVREDGEEFADAFYIELVLHGLGSLGDDAGRLFERAILGYRDTLD